MGKRVVKVSGESMGVGGRKDYSAEGVSGCFQEAAVWGKEGEL